MCILPVCIYLFYIQHVKRIISEGIYLLIFLRWYHQDCQLRDFPVTLILRIEYYVPIITDVHRMWRENASARGAVGRGVSGLLRGAHVYVMAYQYNIVSHKGVIYMSA